MSSFSLANSLFVQKFPASPSTIESSASNPFIVFHCRCAIVVTPRSLTYSAYIFFLNVFGSSVAHRSSKSAMTRSASGAMVFFVIGVSLSDVAPRCLFTRGSVLVLAYASMNCPLQTIALIAMCVPVPLLESWNGWRSASPGSMSFLPLSM